MWRWVLGLCLAVRVGSGRRRISLRESVRTTDPCEPSQICVGQGHWATRTHDGTCKVEGSKYINSCELTLYVVPRHEGPSGAWGHATRTLQWVSPRPSANIKLPVSTRHGDPQPVSGGDEGRPYVRDDRSVGSLMSGVGLGSLYVYTLSAFRNHGLGPRRARFTLLDQWGTCQRVKGSEVRGWGPSPLGRSPWTHRRRKRRARHTRPDRTPAVDRLSTTGSLGRVSNLYADTSGETPTHTSTTT